MTRQDMPWYETGVARDANKRRREAGGTSLTVSAKNLRLLWAEHAPQAERAVARVGTESDSCPPHNISSGPSSAVALWVRWRGPTSRVCASQSRCDLLQRVPAACTWATSGPSTHESQAVVGCGVWGKHGAPRGWFESSSGRPRHQRRPRARGPRPRLGHALWTAAYTCTRAQKAVRKQWGEGEDGLGNTCQRSRM